MSKSILVIDTPKNCAECKLMFLQGIGESICNAVDWEERPSLCPLRPLPKKKTEEEEMAKDPFNEDLFYDEYIWGWNACLDEILGETE